MSTRIPFPSEKFIEDYIYNKAVMERECPLLNEDVQHAYSQLSIKNYGIADIVYVNTIPYPDSFYFEIKVIELKNEPISARHIAQLCRYLKGLDNLLKKYSKKLHFSYEIYGVVAGTGLENDVAFLSAYLDSNISLFKIDASLEEGFFSEEYGRDWSKTDDKFDDASGYVRHFINLYKDDKLYV